MSSVEDALQTAGYGVFANALRESPYGEVLESGGPYTLFAPTDSAFEKFSSESMAHLLHGDEALLRAVLGYHFASGKVMSRQFKGKRIRAHMYAGGDLIIDGANGLKVNHARLVQADLVVANCVIHGIDGVLWPREPAKAAA
jgi:uncharacterized surface protein with fasciclin (FAS1) repeats